MTTTDSDQIKQLKAWLGTGSINLFGSPFAGKDTHGHHLAKIFDAPLLGGGDILRGSVVTDHMRHLMSTGELVPTQEYLDIVLPYLSQKAFVGKPLILSSVGRWHGEEQGVLEATTAANHPVRTVVFLDVPEEMIFERWRASLEFKNRSHRADNDAETLQVRLQEFYVKTLPVLDFYRSNGMLVTVDGSPEIEKVTGLILDALTEHSKLTPQG